MRGKITKAAIAKLKRGGPHLSDFEIRGLSARRLPSGIVAFAFRYKAADGKQRWRSIGVLGKLSVEEARAAAKIVAGDVAGGADPVGEIEAAKRGAAESLIATLGKVFLSHYAKQVRGRTLYNAQRIFTRFILPTFGAMQISDIKRSDVVRLLDKIEGDAMSNKTLAILSKFFNWCERRSDDFVSPIPRGLARGNRTSRDRILTDQEIAGLWAVLGTPLTGVSQRFADHLKLILLTGQRPGEVGAMEAHEIVSKDGTPLWLIPASKYKTGQEHAVPLSAQALALVQRIMSDGERRAGQYLFSATGDIPMPDDSGSMSSLRQAINDCRRHRKPMADWCRHDLRRTARTLLARLGIADEIAERVVGHVVGSRVGRTYNRFQYLDERRAALQRLADLIDEITKEPAGAEIVPLRRSAAA